MESFIYFFIIYLMEGIILALYTSNIFRPRHSHWVRFVSLFLIYLVLFVVSRNSIVWLNVCCFLLGNFIYIHVFYESKWNAAFFHAAMTTAIMSLCEITAYPFVLQYTNDSNAFSILIIWAAISKTAYSASLFFLSNMFREKEHHIKGNDSFIFLLISIPVISAIIMLILYTISAQYSINRSHGQLISFGSILLLFMNLMIFYIYAYNQKRNRAFTEVQLLLQKEHDSSKYFQMLLKQNENQSILIHDIKNHLHTLSSLNEQNDREKITSYIQRLTQSPALHSAVRICDNRLLNMILYQYQGQCLDKNISFQLDIRSSIIDFVEDSDITSLFCNLLDNAIESAEKMEDSYVELKVSRRPSTPFTIISLINSCRVSPFVNGSSQLISRKKDPLRHGYGMKSIAKVVEKYHGAMQTYYDAEHVSFHTIIMLKNQI